MPVVLKNNARTVTRQDLTAVASTIVVADGSVFPTLGAGEYFYLTLMRPDTATEIVKVLAVVDNSLTVTRAQEGTAAREFPTGSFVEARVTAASVLEAASDAVDALTLGDLGITATASEINILDGVTATTPTLNAAVTNSTQTRDTVALLLADTTLTYTAGQPGSVTAGQYVRTRSEGFAYTVAASGASDQHVTTAGGVKLYVRPINRVIDFAALGAVADYTGTPLYDGNDGSRITATNNSAAFLTWVRALDETGAVGIFAGHYGLKTPAATAITLTRDLVISGLGQEASVLDFIYEDQTGTTYITSTTANMMLRLNGASKAHSVTFSDMTVKATTFGGVIGGAAAGAANVYYGKVWGILLQNMSNAVLSRVKTERFNGAGFQFELCGTVRLSDCKGFRNARSGYWAQTTDRFEILGGEFAYNGFSGNPGTGYGVTGSFAIGYMLVDGAYFHHNYRKGADSHGCLTFICRNNTFAENANSHIGLPLATESVTVGRTIYIDDNYFTQGATSTEKTWLQGIYTERVANGYTTEGASLIDMTMSMTITGQSDFTFKRNTVRGGYRGTDILSGTNGTAYIRWTGVNSTTTIVGNDIDVPEMGSYTSGLTDNYGLQLFGLPGQSGNEVYIIEDNIIRCNFTTVRTGSVFGAIFTGRDNAEWHVARNRITMRDQWLFGRVGSDGDAPWGGTSGGRRVVDISDNFITGDRSTVSGITKFFGRTTSVEVVSANFARNTLLVGGVPYLFEFVEGANSKRRATSPAKSYTSGQVVANIVFDKLDDTYAKIRAYNSVNPYGGELTFRMESVGFGTVSGTNTQVTATVNQSYVDTDGITKTSVVLTAAATISARSFIIDVDCIGRVESYGVEKIVWA